MAERYTRVFMLPETDLYETGAPLLICEGALLKDTQTGRMIAQLKFRNIGTKPITAVKVSVRAFDAFGTEVKSVPEFQYLDLSVTRDREFGQETPIVLPNAETRSFSCACQGVIFSDGTKWESSLDEWRPLTKQESLETRFGNLAAQYRRDTYYPFAKYAFAEDRDLWLCACGAVNHADETTCHVCKLNREALKAAEAPDKLKEHDEAYQKRLAKQAEAARIEKERKAEKARKEAERKAEEARLEEERKAEQKRIEAKRRKKIVAIVTPIIVACIAFVIVLTTVIIPNGKYNAAVDLYNAGRYDEAITAFTALNGYKDSADQIENCYIGKFGEEKYNLIKNIKVGDTYTFGAYEQDNKSSNGKEDIEWIVLEKDGFSILLISKYALDCQQYNTSYTSVTWETCSLRKWLNGTFLNAAFSAEEQNIIISSTVTPDENPSHGTSPFWNTTDKVFLLSITEVNKYFSSDNARQCQGTEYCYAQGAYKASYGNCCWWLRSRWIGLHSYYAPGVYYDGSVDEYYEDDACVDSPLLAVRPALWIDLG